MVSKASTSNEEITVRAGEQRVRARFLVGCDGGRSTVRKQGGFEFAGTEPEFTGYSVQVEIADPRNSPWAVITRRPVCTRSGSQG